MPGKQEREYLCLQLIGVLVFIHHYVAIFFSQLLADIRMSTQKPSKVHQKVIIVKEALFVFIFDVFLLYLSYLIGIYKEMRIFSVYHKVQVL